MGFLSSLFSSVMNGLGGMFGGGGHSQSMQGGSQAASQGGIFGGGGFNPGMLGLGAGMMALPQMFGGKTQAPNFNTPEMQNMRNFTQNPPVLPQAMQDQINKSLQIQEEQENRNLMNTYESAKPGFDAMTDSAYQRDLANLQRNQQANRANALMGPTLQYQAPLQQGLGNLAGASQENQYVQAAMRAAQQQQMKNMWSGLGSMFVNKGLFPNGGYGNLANMFSMGGR